MSCFNDLHYFYTCLCLKSIGSNVFLLLLNHNVYYIRYICNWKVATKQNRPCNQFRSHKSSIFHSTKNKSNYELNINFLIQKPFVKVIVKDERFNVKQERKNCQNNILIQLQQNYAFACDVRL